MVLEDMYHTPAKIKDHAVAQSGRGADFEPLDVLDDFQSTLPELPSPNCKGCRWNYIDAISKTLEELEPKIKDSLDEKGFRDENLVFKVVIKDGADGMGDVEQHTEASDRFLPSKAFRFSFAIVCVSTKVNGDIVEIFQEPCPSSVLKGQQTTLSCNCR